MIAIFLNNKLISCDTILPLAMEVHQRSNCPVQFFTTDTGTFDAIKANVVLWNAIHEIGSLTLLGRRKPSLLWRILSWLRAGLLLLPLMVRAYFGRAHLLHFKALNHPPLNFLARLAPERIYFCESTPYGVPDLLQRVTEVKTVRRRDPNCPRGGSLVAFDNHWAWLSEPQTAHLPRYVFGPPRKRKTWTDYVERVANTYYRELLGETALGHDETMVVMLGFFGALDYLRTPASVRTRFRELLEILVEEGERRPIILKPHVITDVSILNEELKRFNGGLTQIHVAHLHPSVLAVRARAVFANYYSTTLADAYLMGVPTVEYTDYSDDALNITRQGSMCPEHVSHFIQADPALLRRTIRDILAMPRAPFPKGVTGDASGLLDRLCQ